jgi:hypothetical protein
LAAELTGRVSGEAGDDKTAVPHWAPLGSDACGGKVGKYAGGASAASAEAKAEILT